MWLGTTLHNLEVVLQLALLSCRGQRFDPRKRSASKTRRNGLDVSLRNDALP